MDLISLSRQQIHRIIRYCCVGSINTLVATSVMAILSYLNVRYIIYTAIAYITAMLVSFGLNFKFTFNSNGFLQRRLVNFFSINIFNLILVELIEVYLIELEGLPHFDGILVGMFWYVITGFILNQWLVFHPYQIKQPYAVIAQMGITNIQRTFSRETKLREKLTRKADPSLKRAGTWFTHK